MKRVGRSASQLLSHFHDSRWGCKPEIHMNTLRLESYFSSHQPRFVADQKALCNSDNGICAKGQSMTCADSDGCKCYARFVLKSIGELIANEFKISNSEIIDVTILATAGMRLMRAVDQENIWKRFCGWTEEYQLSKLLMRGHSQIADVSKANHTLTFRYASGLPRCAWILC